MGNFIHQNLIYNTEFVTSDWSDCPNSTYLELEALELDASTMENKSFGR